MGMFDQAPMSGMAALMQQPNPMMQGQGQAGQAQLLQMLMQNPELRARLLAMLSAQGAGGAPGAGAGAPMAAPAMGGPPAGLAGLFGR